MLATVERPRPVPFSGDFVVKNGSKMRGKTSSGIPVPVSATETNTNGPGEFVLGAGISVEAGRSPLKEVMTATLRHGVAGIHAKGFKAR